LQAAISELTVHSDQFGFAHDQRPTTND
jgi:hypothetical protein